MSMQEGCFFVNSKSMAGLQYEQLLPDSRHHQLKTGYRSIALNRGWVVMHFWLLAGSVNSHHLTLWVDQPGYLGSVRDPLHHLAFQYGETVALGTKFNDEVWTEGRKTVFVLL